jgi:hypothetical protein
MAYFTGDAIGLSRRNIRYNSRLDYSIKCSCFFPYHSSNSAIFNTVSNAGCIALIAYSASAVFRSQHTNALAPSTGLSPPSRA